MSSRIGTLDAPRAERATWPVAFVAVLIMLTIAVVAVSMGREEAREPVAQPTVSGTAANTPTEIRAAHVEIEATDAIVPHVPRRGADADSVRSTAGNTPSEMSGGFVGRTSFEKQQI